MKKIYIIFAICMMLYGCAGKLMERTAVDYDMKLDSGKAAVIFIRTSGEFSAPIAEYKNNDVSFIGNSTGGSIIMDITNAGKHEYIIAAGRGTVLKADLKAGMFYYVYILQGYKNNRAILYCEPYEPNKSKQILLANGYEKNINESSVKNDSKHIMWQKNTPDGYTWFEVNKPSFISKYKYAYKTYNVYEIRADMGVNALIK